MEQSLAKKEPRERKTADLVSKIKRREVVTLSIPKDRLPFYLEAASATGFKVEKIADEGEEFPFLKMVIGKSGTEKPEYDSDGTPKVSSLKVAGKNFIAVAIEKPKGSVDHNAFWDNLNTKSWEK